MMKRFACLLMLLFFVSSAYSLSLSSNSTIKGDTIVINGLNPGEKVDIYVDGEHYYSFVADGESMEYTLSFLDPSGKWLFVGSENNATLEVKNSYQSKALLLTFLSPINSSYYFVGSDVEFRLNVTKNLIPVSNVSCYLFYDGVYVKMDSDKSICSYTLFLLPNQTLGMDRAVVLASDGELGGEEEIFFILKSNPINIELLEPKLSKIMYGSTIQFHLNFSYNSGYEVYNPAIVINAGGKEINFNKTGSSIYFNYTVDNTSLNILDLEVSVVDEYGNQGKFVHSFELEGKNTYLLSKYKWHIVLLATAIIVVLYVIFTLNYKRIRLFRLEKRKAELLELEKKVQTEYYKLGTIDYDTYEKTMEEYNLELSKIKDEIKRLKKGGR